MREILKNSYVVRKQVSDGMLKAYGEEVPLFKILYEKVQDINEKCFEDSNNIEFSNKLAGANLEQLGNVRHAAVRLAMPEEMEMFARVMSNLGQFPVGYYDLTSSGTPVQSTAFRPIHEEQLLDNAFTIFSSLLDVKALDFSSDPELENVLVEVLHERKVKHFKGEGIFTKRLMELTEQSEISSLSEEERSEYAKEVVDTFQMNDEALVDKETYERIKNISPVAADIIGAGLNINHLTPDTLDIEAVYEGMRVEVNPVTGKDIVMNGFIYGPKDVYILLEQTSFKAITVNIPTTDGEVISHQARFGEVESRGMATTVTGREKYDKVLSEINQEIDSQRDLYKSGLKEGAYKGSIRDVKEAELGREYIRLGKEKFPNEFPANEQQLALDGLVYFK